MRLKILASFALLSVFSTSYAKVIYSSGDWQLDDLSSKKDLNGVCLISTDKKIGKVEWSLRFVHPKNKLAPTVIQLTQKNKAALGWTAVLDSGETLSFAHSSTDDKIDHLWSIPQDSQALVVHFENKNDLRLIPADGSKDIKLIFSADGFKKVKDRMIKECLAGAPLIDTEFESSFLTKKDRIDPMKLNGEAVKELKRLFYAGYSVHLNILDNQDEMEKLRGRFRAQLNESSSLNSLIERLSSRDIPQIKKDSDDNDLEQESQTSELAKTSALIVTQEKNIVSAEKVLNTAKDVIAPFEQEHASRQDRADGARADVNQLAGRLNSIDQGISQTTTRINQLNYDAGTLQDHNNRLEGDLRLARMAHLRSERAAGSFEPRHESRRRINQDRMLQDANREMGPLQRNMDSLDSALKDARGKTLTREAELRVCQSRTGYISQDSYRLPAQERTRPNGDNRPGGRPGNDEPRPNPPTTPASPTPSAPVTPTGADCTAEINALNSAKLVEADLSNQRKDLWQKIQVINSRADAIERRIIDEVNREKEDLLRRAQADQRRAIEIDSQMESNSRRLENIRNEMPSQQNTLYSLQNERPNVLDQLNQAVPVSNRFSGDLKAYEAKVGWDAKVEAIQVASQNLKARISELNLSEAKKGRIENTIANCKSRRISLRESLEARELQKSQSEARLVQVTKSLEPFEDEKTKINNGGSDLKNQLAGLAVEFENQIP